MRRLLIVPLILGFSLSLCAQQPGNMTQVGGVNVSLYSTLFNATSATATQTSSAIRLPGFSGHGILSVIFQTLTGSPATCQIALEMQQNTGTPASAAFFTQAITPSASYQSFAVVPSANFDAGDTVVAVWSCGTYPTISTTMTVTFNPTPFVVSAEVDGQKNTYRASAVGFTAAAGIIADLTGSATKTIRVTEVDVACSTSGTAAFTDLAILKNSSADTVGTSATMTVTPHDSANDPAGSATAKNYTAAPTAGTLAGTLYSYRFLNQGSTTVQPTLWSWRPGTNPGARAVVLRGTAQQLAVKLAAVVATETCDVAFEWTEE